MVLGFDNAPVALGFSLAVVAQTVLSVRNGATAPFSLSHVLAGDYKRCFTSFTTFDNYSQLAVGVVMIFMCRVFERHFGSRKFGALVFFAWVLAILLSVGVAVLSDSTGVLGTYAPSNGPYFIIFALLFLFHKSIPTLTPSQYSFLGMGISEKTWTYLLGAQLALNAGVRSVVPALVGILIGLIYQNNPAGIQGWRLPAAVEKLAALVFFFLPSPAGVTVSSRSSPSVSPSTSSGRVTRSAASAERVAAMAEGVPEGNPRDGRVRQPSWTEATQARLHDYGGLGDAIQPPTEEQIKTITDLGFDRTKAVHALEQCDNNVEQAANFILR